MSDQSPIIALEKIYSYHDSQLKTVIHKMLDMASMPAPSGSKVLVKPNLLTSVPLACTNPAVVAAICEWLLDHNCKITVADSPGFGNVTKVANQIGLTEALKPLGLKIQPMDSPKTVELYPAALPHSIKLEISEKALAADWIFSVCKVKAHSQMRMTLSVKNCYGCIPGLRKAIVHARYGKTAEFFATCIAALYQKLPPTRAFADGIEAMSGTGPSKGFSYPLNLLGACANPVALDFSILKILEVSTDLVPLAAVLQKLYPAASRAEAFTYPLKKPEDFSGKDFQIPVNLKSASFNPLRLARSLLKRLWKEYKP